MSGEAEIAALPPRRGRALLVVAATLALGLAPIAVSGAAPQSDTVVHLRHAAAWRTGGDAHHELTGVSLLRPYQVTHRLMGAALAVTTGEGVLIGLGVVTIVAGALAATVLAGAASLEQLAARWPLLLVFAGLGYSSFYYQGFANFRLGQAVALLLLARRLDRPGRWGPALDVALLGLAYLLHPFALGLGLLAVLLARPADTGPLRRAPDVAALLLGLATASAGGGEHGGLPWIMEDLRVGLTASALGGKLTRLAMEAFAWRSPLEGALGLGGFVLACLALSGRRAVPTSRGLATFLAAVTGLFVLLPYFLASIAAVNERFAPTVYVLVVALLARGCAWPRPRGRQAALAVAGMAVLVGAACCHLRLEAERAAFQPLAARMEPGRRLSVADLTGGTCSYLVTRDYLLVAGGVTPAATFVNALLPTRQRPMPAPRHVEDAAAYLQADYVAVRVAPGREHLPTFAARCREVARAGRWRLLAPARDE